MKALSFCLPLITWEQHARRTVPASEIHSKQSKVNTVCDRPPPESVLISAASCWDVTLLVTSAARWRYSSRFQYNHTMGLDISGSVEDYGGILSRAGSGLFTVRGTGDEAIIGHKYNQRPVNKVHKLYYDYN